MKGGAERAWRERGTTVALCRSLCRTRSFFSITERARLSLSLSLSLSLYIYIYIETMPEGKEASESTAMERRGIFLFFF
jgi:hypothetical protein